MTNDERVDLSILSRALGLSPAQTADVLDREADVVRATAELHDMAKRLRADGEAHEVNRLACLRKR
jgi:hypothetical protein